MSLRIAFVTQPFSRLELPLHSDSIGIWTYEVARRCAAAADVTIYTRALERTTEAVEEHEGVEIHRVRVGPDLRLRRASERVGRWAERLGRTSDPRRPGFASRLFYPGYATQIARDLRRRSVDVVHVHNFSQFVPILRSAHPRARFLLHMHCEWLSQLAPELVRPRVAQADRVLGCSEFVTERIRTRFPEFARRCHTLYNGVDLARFVPAGDGAASPGGGPRLLFVGRLSPEKGVHVLLEAFAKVLTHHPEARLEIVGPQQTAPPEYIPELSDDPLVQGLAPLFAPAYVAEIQARAAGELAPHVTLTPHIAPEELVPRYQAADVFIFPSVWEEPFGMPVIEALACARPVVATRGGGLPEIVQDGETGLLVPRGDAVALAEAILTLLREPERARAMGIEGRRRVAERFSWDRVSERVLEHAESR